MCTDLAVLTWDFVCWLSADYITLACIKLLFKIRLISDWDFCPTLLLSRSLEANVSSHAVLYVFQQYTLATARTADYLYASMGATDTQMDLSATNNIMSSVCKHAMLKKVKVSLLSSLSTRVSGSIKYGGSIFGSLYGFCWLGLPVWTVIDLIDDCLWLWSKQHFSSSIGMRLHKIISYKIFSLTLIYMF